MPRFAAMYDAAALRALERRAALPPGDDLALMRRAGASAWRCLLRHWPHAQRIVVACGPGNNGGDGCVLAAHALQAGRDVAVVRLPPETPRARDASPPESPAVRALAEYERGGGLATRFDGSLPVCDVIVDAVFGTGLSRAPEGDAARLLSAIDVAGAPVLSLDAPSGVDAATGAVPGIAVHAACTLQFLAAHPGLATGAALDHGGQLELDALGLDPQWLEGTVAFAELMRPCVLPAWLPRRARDSHKGDNGHVLCVGGDHGGGGAIVLCAQAALRSGAGLVGVATRGAHVQAMLARQPEAMAHAVESKQDIEPLLARAGSIAIGPGLGKGDWGRALFAAASSAGKPLLLDADALNVLAETPRQLPGETILTPHPGEAARLLDSDVATVQGDRYGAARELVERFRCVVVLKGAGTIVAAPGCVPRVVAAGNPGMATGGMGDLLTGVIAALRAQGMRAFDAAACGALLHAHAGDSAAKDGMRGLLPSDLLPCLRRHANPAG